MDLDTRMFGKKIIYFTIQKFGFYFLFFKEVSYMITKLHLFNKKYNKNSRIVK